MAVDAGQRRDGFSSGAASRLMAHDWPGNIRELAAVVWRLVVFPGNGPVHEHEVQRAMF
jgi:DNA-binding NtrC family response regulator